MTEKALFENESPVTQSTEAVKALLKFYNHGQEVAELPPIDRLGSELSIGV